MSVMFERFDADARRGIVHAQELARTRGEDVGVAHLVIGAAAEGGLADLDVKADEVMAALNEGLGEAGDPTEENPRFTRDGKKTLELALREALRAGSNRITPAHVVLGAMRTMDPVVTEVFDRFPVGDLPDDRTRRGRKRRSRGERGVWGPAGTGNGNVLLAFFDYPESVPARVLADLGV